MYKLGTIIGKRVVAVRDRKDRKNQKEIKPGFILFDDGETLIILEEQDSWSYHDCSSSARELVISVDRERWEHVMKSEKYGDANTDIDW